MGFWGILAGLGGLLGAFFVLVGFFGGNSAPQEAAAAAMAVAVTVIPYVWFRISQLEQQLAEQQRTNALLQAVLDAQAAASRDAGNTALQAGQQPPLPARP